MSQPQELMHCPVCYLVYSQEVEPRMLTCGHTVCLKCLEIMLKDDLKCPEDQQSLAFKDINNYPKNYLIMKKTRIIARNLRQANHNKTKSLNDQDFVQNDFLKSLNSIVIEGEIIGNVCTIHCLQKTYFCQEENKQICQRCSLDHLNHSVITCQEYQQQIKSKITQIEALSQSISTKESETQNSISQLSKSLREHKIRLELEAQKYFEFLKNFVIDEERKIKSLILNNQYIIKDRIVNLKNFDLAKVQN